MQLHDEKASMGQAAEEQLQAMQQQQLAVEELPVTGFLHRHLMMPVVDQNSEDCRNCMHPAVQVDCAVTSCIGHCCQKRQHIESPRIMLHSFVGAFFIVVVQCVEPAPVLNQDIEDYNKHAE